MNGQAFDYYQNCSTSAELDVAQQKYLESDHNQGFKRNYDLPESRSNSDEGEEDED